MSQWSRILCQLQNQIILLPVPLTGTVDRTRPLFILSAQKELPRRKVEALHVSVILWRLWNQELKSTVGRGFCVFWSFHEDIVSVMVTLKREHLIIMFHLHFRVGSQAKQSDFIQFDFTTSQSISLMHFCCYWVDCNSLWVLIYSMFSFCWLMLLAEWLNTHTDLLWHL